MKPEWFEKWWPWLLLANAGLAVAVGFFSITVSMLFYGISNGLAIWHSVSAIFARRRKTQFEEQIGRLPAEAMPLGVIDGQTVVSVTRKNGEMITINVPEGYDPQDDGAETVIRQTNPELFPPEGE